MNVTQEQYAILYINTQDPDISDILTIKPTLDSAIYDLIKRAGYTLDSSRNLYQFGLPCTEYRSIEELYNKILVDQLLQDSTTEIYKITRILV